MCNSSMMREYQKMNHWSSNKQQKKIKQGARNTGAAAQLKKNDMSEHMNMFNMFIENSLARSIVIVYDIATFSEIWEIHLDKMICDEIIEFNEVSNCTINLSIK